MQNTAPELIEQVHAKTEWRDGRTPNVLMELRRQDDGGGFQHIISYPDGEADQHVDTYSAGDDEKARETFEKCLEKLQDVVPIVDRWGLIDGFDDATTALEGGPEPEPEPEPEPDAPGAQVWLNNEKNGVEIKFSDKPPASIRDRLKENGWRWSSRNKLWYHHQNGGSHLDFAREIVGELGELDPADHDPRDLLRRAADELTGELATIVGDYLDATE